MNVEIVIVFAQFALGCIFCMMGLVAIFCIACGKDEDPEE